MNVLIFAGGTGSVAIQTGLHLLYGNNVDVRVITNTQDNGKSTGTVRKVLDGKINGPSDLRKNQVLRYELNSGNKNLIHLLNRRFNCASQDAHDYCINLVNKMAIVDERAPKLDSLTLSTLLMGVETYFSFPKATQVDYVDFSFANIVYAGLAAPNFSLAEAGKIMARNVLQIPEDAVIVADDHSLYLQARTESGRIISDEGDIVDWNNPADKIVDTFFTDSHGTETKGFLSVDALVAIDEADIIIFSSGTQWSSLIPTYQHNFFKEALEKSKAKKFLIVNNTQDKDMTGVTASEMLTILGTRFLDLTDVVCVFNDKAEPDMMADFKFMTDRGWKYISADLADVMNGSKKTHDGRKLVKMIMFDYYFPTLLNDTFVFDYDDTLVGRNSTYLETSQRNKEMLIQFSNALRNMEKSFCICTGNSIKAINFGNVGMSPNLSIFAEGGVNRYELTSVVDEESYSSVSTLSAEKVIAPEYIFRQDHINDIISNLEKVGINLSKIQNRKNTIISIKPVDPEYRKPLLTLIRILFKDLTVEATGRTTIDISLGATKDVILSELDKGRITVIGDESHVGGNDHSLAINDRVDFVKVKTPKDTYVFLLTLGLYYRLVLR